MKCSFLVSVFHEKDTLTSLLYALKIQTDADFEVLVCDNSPAYPRTGLRILKHLRDDRVRWIWTGKTCTNCYESANAAAAKARGDYLCFPSCDNYYVPQFLERMLKPAKDLMYCDMVYDPRGGDNYRVIEVLPMIGLIDKGGFLIKREKFAGFPWARQPDGQRFADGMLIEDLLRTGASHAKVPGVLFVHN